MKKIAALLACFLTLIVIASVCMAEEAALPADGFTTEGEGFTSVVHWIPSSDGLDLLFSRIYYPTDFDDNKNWPVVIMAHGKDITCDIYNTYYAPYTAQAGIVCVAYDVRGVVGQFGRSSYSTNNAGIVPDLQAYANELDTVLDYVKTLPYADLNNIYLWGQSMGSRTSQLILGHRGSEIRGAILLYGAPDSADGPLNSILPEDSQYRSENVIPGLNAYENEVLIVLGSEDNLIDLDKAVENAYMYRNYTLVYISGAGHGFGFRADRPAQICAENAVKFIQRTMAK